MNSAIEEATRRVASAEQAEARAREGSNAQQARSLNIKHMNGKRVGLYLRVSTDDQTVENQREALTAACEARGWRIVETFEDAGRSGAKGRDKRPGFDKLHKAVTRRSIDVVAAWSVDRLGRSLQDLVGFLAELNAVGCDLYLEQQAVDTTTPAGRAMFQMLGVFGEFERSIIQARQGRHCAGPQARYTQWSTIRPPADVAPED